VEKVKGNAQDEQDLQQRYQKQLQGRLPGLILNLLSML
jgi:hypothetical protein